MNKTETIEAIDKLIEKYRGRFKYPCAEECPLCTLYNNGLYTIGDKPCKECINKVFGHCSYRPDSYNLNHYKKIGYPNLVKFWISVKAFLSPLEEDINIEDIKPHILKLAEPYKKQRSNVHN